MTPTDLAREPVMPGERRQPSGVALGVVGDAKRREPDALADPERRRVGVDEGREDPMDVDLHDRKDAWPVEARGKTRLLQREGVERSLAREVHPFEPVRRALP